MPGLEPRLYPEGHAIRNNTYRSDKPVTKQQRSHKPSKENNNLARAKLSAVVYGYKSWVRKRGALGYGLRRQTGKKIIERTAHMRCPTILQIGQLPGRRARKRLFTEVVALCRFLLDVMAPKEKCVPIAAPTWHEVILIAAMVVVAGRFANGQIAQNSCLKAAIAGITWQHPERQRKRKGKSERTQREDKRTKENGDKKRNANRRGVGPSLPMCTWQSQQTSTCFFHFIAFVLQHMRVPICRACSLWA